MQEEDLKLKIEKWATSHFGSKFVYYILSIIFLFLFAYIFYVNINESSLLFLVVISFVPSFFVTLLSFLLFRELFIWFFVSLLIITPILVISLTLFTLFVPAGSYGYVLYTNNFTKKCDVRVMDYKKGPPWYATKGCELKDGSKDMIRRYIQVGGNAMRWQDACQELRIIKSELTNDYENIINNNKDFNLIDEIKSNDYGTSTKEYSLITKIKDFETDRLNNLSSFKKDVPNITAVDIIDICSMDHFYLGKFRVF